MRVKGKAETVRVGGFSGVTLWFHPLGAECALAVALVLGLTSSAGAQTPPSSPSSTSATTAPPVFTYQQVMIPMRDGPRLQTVILTPTRVHRPLPILLRRTPYGVPDKAPPSVPFSLKALDADGYIFVIQNVRGRFMSEGVFSLADEGLVTPGRGTIDSRDAYDTIDWLVKNVPGNTGKVGIYGVSYDGETAGETLLDPHPALKAVSEQAAPTDEWMNDDDHRYGALRLSYDFEYAVLEEADKNANTHFNFETWDTYQWYLDAGPLSFLNEHYLHGAVPYWNNAIVHPNYDRFWKSKAWAHFLHKASVPTLNVAGFWDQEDPWGPWQIYRAEAKDDPNHVDLMVAGPWNHGGWRRSTTNLGVIPLGQDPSQTFLNGIEAPFFAYWLKDKGSKPNWTATTFQTGSNSWKTYAAWPPAAAVDTNLYLHADGALNWTRPNAKEVGSNRSYVSDPSNPAPYRPRPISPTYPGADWRDWESGDQRFVDHRPDVLSYTTSPLDHDVVVTGSVSAELFASTSGADSDFIVKLIDVFPEDAAKATWNPDDGPALGDYAKVINGYEWPIAMEVRRGRFLKSYEAPSALVPNKPIKWVVPLRDRDHVFKKGHRIMVQIQSTWFPLIDRNPQTFMPSIYSAKAIDYQPATQKVYSAPGLASRIILPVIP